MEVNVIKRAKKNIVFGGINKAVFLLCPFIIRTVIQYSLGSQYLGLDSLFNSIISVLSLTELGFSSAIISSMYKPVAEGDTKKVNSLLLFYKKAYRVIGVVILAIGILLVPFLPLLIKGEYPSDINLTTIYLVYLINTSLSYFLFAYLSSLVVVHQRDDLNSTVNSIAKIGLTFCQILLLVITKNYFLFILATPIFTILNNLLLAFIVKRKIPGYKCEGSLEKNELKNIKKMIFGAFIQKACQTTRNSLDSICISVFLGLSTIAIYNNYFYILASISGVITIVSTAFIGGIGNHVVTQSKDENFIQCKNLDFAYLSLSAFCACSLLCLYQPFMTLWMGNDMLLDNMSIVLLVIYFFVLKLGDIRAIYASTNGLWWQQKWRAIVETIVNIVLNIILGKYFGVHGIILATIISIVFVNYIWGVYITFKYYFGKEKVKNYLFYQLRISAVSILTCFTSILICSIIQINNLYLTLFVRLAVCVAVFVTIFVVLYFKTDEFSYFINRIVRKKEGQRK